MAQGRQGIAHVAQKLSEGWADARDDVQVARLRDRPALAGTPRRLWHRLVEETLGLARRTRLGGRARRQRSASDRSERLDVGEEPGLDLERLSLRRRRQHDLRRTFISLALGDGARKDVLVWVTHGTSRDVMDMYTTLPWHSLCAEVAKLRIDLLEGQVLDLPEPEAEAEEPEAATLEPDALLHRVLHLVTEKRKAPKS